MKYLILFFCFSYFGLFAQIPSYVPTNGLVGWWPFNGNANDESGKGNHGTVTGASLTLDRFGNTNTAYNFDGVSNKIYIGDPAVNELDFKGNPFTISLWVKNISLSYDNQLIMKRNKVVQQIHRIISLKQ